MGGSIWIVIFLVGGQELTHATQAVQKTCFEKSLHSNIDVLCPRMSSNSRFMGRRTVVGWVILSLEFTAPFISILTQGSEFKFRFSLPLIVCAMLRLETYDFTVEDFRFFLAIAQVRNALATLTSIGRSLLIL